LSAFYRGADEVNAVKTEGSAMRWVILLEIYLCMGAYAVVFQSIPPVMSLIIGDFHLSHHQAGLLMSMFALPGILVSLPAGMLADRYGVKTVGIISLAVTIVGTLLVARGHSFEVILAGRIIAGTGASSLVIIVPQAIAQWFSGRHMGIAMGIFNTAMPIGTIVSLNMFPVLAGIGGWRSGVWTTILFTALALVVFALFYRSPDRTAGKEHTVSENPPRVGRVGLSIWLVGGAWAFFNASIISLFTFAPDFMVSRGLTLGSAGFYTSLVMVGSMVLSPIIGLTVDRIGRKEAFIALGGLGMAAVLAILPGVGQNFGPVFLCVGFTAALIPAPVFSLVADVVSHNRLGLGYGILSMLNNVGIFVGPQLVGLSRDATASYKGSFWLMAFFALLATVTILALLVKKQRSPAR
jgi:MFS family permease